MEAGILQLVLERVPGTELEEEGAHLGVDPGVHDGKHLRPSAPAPFTPDRSHRPATGPKDPSHLPDGRLGIGHIHEPQGAEDHVERGVWKVQGFGVHPLEGDVLQLRLCHGRSGFVQHPLGEIGSHDPPTRAHGPGHTMGHEPRAAGRLQHLLPRIEGGHLQQEILGRGQGTPPGRVVDCGGPVPPVALHAELQPGIHGFSPPPAK